MRGEESLRVLDIGPTSSTNINFITELGHSIYLANLVEDAAKQDWSLPQENGEGTRFDVDRFLAAHLNFSGRGFDVVLFWDTADYLPQELLVPVLERIHAVMVPEDRCWRCFIRRRDCLHGGGKDGLPPLPPDRSKHGGRAASGGVSAAHKLYDARLRGCSSRSRAFIFFLAKDNMREVVVTR